MSFLKKLFGGGRDQASPRQDDAGKPEEYKGYTIRATPFEEGGQYQTCGIVSKDVEGTVKEHRFIRADRFPSRDDVIQTTLRKGRQLVDEQGDRLFDQN